MYIERNGTPEFGKLDLRALEEVLESGAVSHGAQVNRLEEHFSGLTRHADSIAFNSWTSAAYSYFKWLREKTGAGEVILPSFTFSATGNVVLSAGLTPRFADVSPRNFSLDLRSVAKLIQPDTRAIMVVHYAGLYDHQNTIALSALANENQIQFIEDCAESYGAASSEGEYSGSIGTSIFSLYATKGITSGEGGVISTSDQSLARYLRYFRAHGVEKSRSQFWRRNAIMVGQNFRMANLNAALGLAQVEQFPLFLEKRVAVANRYYDRLGKFSGVILPATNGMKPSWQMFPILVKSEIRNLVVTEVAHQGIGVSVHFDPPLHRQDVFRTFSQHELPATLEISKSVITLPMHSLLSTEEVDLICDRVVAAIQSHS